MGEKKNIENYVKMQGPLSVNFFNKTSEMFQILPSNKYDLISVCLFLTNHGTI